MVSLKSEEEENWSLYPMKEPKKNLFTIKKLFNGGVQMHTYKDYAEIQSKTGLKS